MRAENGVGPLGHAIAAVLLFSVLLLAGCGASEQPRGKVRDKVEFRDTSEVSPMFRDAARRLNQKDAWGDRRLDCTDFSSWEMAQALEDRRRLDRNENGVACEALR